MDEGAVVITGVWQRAHPVMTKSLRPFSIEADEMTPTQKVRRGQIVSKYRDRLDALYDDKNAAKSWDV